MEDQNEDPRFILDEETRKEREEKGQILKRENELQDLSNMDLSKYNQRVPLIEQLAHGIHNVTDRITGVFKHKEKTTIPEKEQSSQSTENQGIQEEELGSYIIGGEFRENFEGFSKTMENAESGRSLAGREYNLHRFEEEQETRPSAEHLEFKIQSISTSGSTAKGSSILKQLEEDIKLIDQLLEKTIEKGGTKIEYKGGESVSRQGQGGLSNQCTEIGTNIRGSSLSQQVYKDVNANDNLLDRAILGEKNASREGYESSATNLYNKDSKSRGEKFRDITNVAGSISQKAEKDLSNNDKLLDKSIREGKAGYRVEPEDKENIGKKGPSMAGGNISHCDGMRDLTQTL